MLKGTPWAVWSSAGEPAWAKIEGTKGSGRAGNGNGDGESQFPTSIPPVSSMIIFTLDPVLCSQGTWGKSRSWFVYRLYCSRGFLFGSNVSRRVIANHF